MSDCAIPSWLGDMPHIRGCRTCQSSMLSLIKQGRIKLTPELMLSIRNDLFKQEVIKAACLRVAHLPTGGHENA